MPNRYEEKWLETVARQEELLVFDHFSREDGLALGLKIAELAKTKYTNVGIRILSDDFIVFTYMMEGSTMNNNWWMDKKLNVCRKTGVSSLRAALEFVYGVREKEPWTANEGNYALVGGCIPIRLKSGELAGWALVSALPHEQDHQLIADAMADFLTISIPSILE